MPTDSLSFELTHPARLAWLLLLPVLVYFFIRSLSDFPRWQRSISLAVRTVVVLLLICSLAGLTLLHPTKEKFVIFAVDRSLSVGDESTKQADQFIEQAIAKADKNRIAVLPFTHEPGQLQSQPSATKTDSTKPTETK